MAHTLTIADAHTSLAYRLGESATPNSTTELAKRLDWFKRGISQAIGQGKPLWFMQKKAFDTTIADQQDYDIPTRMRQLMTIKVDDYEYEQTTRDDYYEKFEVPNSPVPILPSFMARQFYLWADKIYFVPIPSAAPTSYTVTLTQSGGTATATSTEAHGFLRGMHITIAGADQTEYNGSQEILTVPSTTTFTFTVDSGATSPATGTITAVRKNIEVWYYEEPQLPTGTTSSIVVPDDYIDLLVSYAEGRYWSSAHKRGKASDAFIEYETLKAELKNEDIRRSFMVY